MISQNHVRYMTMNEIRAQGLLAQRYNTHYFGLTYPVLASTCSYTNNLSSHPGGDTMQLRTRIQNALKAAVTLDPEALGLFVGGRRRNRRRKRKSGQNKRKEKKTKKQKNVEKEKLTKDPVKKKEEKNPLIKTDYNDNISCSIGSQLIYGLSQTNIGPDDIDTKKEIPEEVVISQPMTTWENKVEDERKDNSINNAQLLKDIDIDKLLSDDVVIASKLSKSEVMAAMDEIQIEGLQLISLDDDDEDGDEDEEEEEEEEEEKEDEDEDEESDCDDFDDLEGNNNAEALSDELKDAINASNMYGVDESEDTAEQETSYIEVEVEKFGEDFEEDEMVIESQPEIQDEFIVKPEKVPLLERACPVSGQKMDVACCVIL